MHYNSSLFQVRPKFNIQEHKKRKNKQVRSGVTLNVVVTKGIAFLEAL